MTPEHIYFSTRLLPGQVMKRAWGWGVQSILEAPPAQTFEKGGVPGVLATSSPGERRSSPHPSPRPLPSPQPLAGAAPGGPVAGVCPQGLVPTSPTPIREESEGTRQTVSTSRWLTGRQRSRCRPGGTWGARRRRVPSGPAPGPGVLGAGGWSPVQRPPRRPPPLRCYLALCLRLSYF